MKSYRVTAMLLALIAVFALSASAFSVLEGVESGTEPLSDSEQAALNEVTSTLLFYQDFDHLEPRVYSSGEITSMIAGTEGNALVDFGAMNWGVITHGCTFEICEEENGNRYLKVTGDTYKAFGVWFENDSLQLYRL